MSFMSTSNAMEAQKVTTAVSSRGGYKQEAGQAWRSWEEGTAPPTEEAEGVGSCQDGASNHWNQRNVVTGTWTWSSHFSEEMDQGWNRTR